MISFSENATDRITDKIESSILRFILNTAEKMHAAAQRTAAQREATFEELLPTFWIRPAMYLTAFCA